MTAGAGDAVRAAVITASDRAASGERPDATGPELIARLAAAGYACDAAIVIPDGEESVADALRAALDSGARLVVTTGGTGVGPRDRTPEGTRPVLERELPGIPELLRREGAESTPFAVLTRGIAGVTGEALIVNLPGSTRGAIEGLGALLPLVPHVLDQLRGGDHR
ncbi:MogA/MoaB family molybdenum cofactor biosynthesis protein [Microbacterium sediminicola]|uniref:MogA/MoaB family molybdenum cofactor biosynthesis protein n=1 Tax=Microbacterium sediminicola TaxID=415210 RepID=A0ABN2HGD0_9MICO